MMKKKYLLVFHCLFVLSPWRVELSHGICCTCAPQHTHNLFILVIIATEEMLKVNSPIRRNSCLLPTLSHIYRYHQMPQQREYELIIQLVIRNITPFQNLSISGRSKVKMQILLMFLCFKTCKYECSEQKK